MSGSDAHHSRGSAPSASESLREYARGLAGGLLFSLPLLYTMEVWWTSFIAGPWRLIALLAFTFLLLLGYNRFAGLRHDATWTEVAIDSVEELGLGIVTSALVLFLLGQISPAMPFAEAVPKIVVEATIVAIGFSVGSAQLGTGRGDMGKDESSRGARSVLAQRLVIAFCGAVLFAANVAPTEEIVMIAVETGPLRLAGAAVLSLLLAAAVLYLVGFRKGRGRSAPPGREIVMGTAMTYAVALVASALLLWFFGRFDGAAADICARQTVVLGLPAALGASAGPLLLQP
ncbi:MAG TPA: TIGR02587 family membrane protein [Thermoanaerobaculia bacterium]|nr:TIGR02587 family membrane protein [Thermoanaerobaculia bacterium]